MKIIEIKIENFGRLSGFRKTLTSGVNAINEENGWGKSTLTAFIKVMFFGFDGEKNKKNERERERFRPWQSGTYGGSMVFEAGGREYRMSRTFGLKPAEDTYTLYDNKTNLPSSDYSDKIGEELFGLDSDSFCRTVLINQNHIETGTTGSINAKLGNLTQATDDIDNYEEVDKKFNDKLNNISSGRKTGLLRKMNDELSGLRTDIRTVPDIESRVSSLNGTLAGLNDKFETVKIEETKLNDEIGKASRAAELISRKEQYDGICGRFQERKKAVDAAAFVFTKEIPDEGDINRYAGEARTAADMKLEAAGYSLTPEEEAMYRNKKIYFTSGISPTDIYTAEKAAEEISKKEREYDSLQFSEEEKADYVKYSKKFNGMSDIDMTASQLIDNLSFSNSTKSAIPGKEVILQSYSLPKVQKQSYLWLILLVFGIVAAGAGAVILLAVSKLAGIITVSVGAALVMAAFSIKFLAKTKPEENTGDSPADALRKTISDEKELVQNTENSVRQFLEEFGIDFDCFSATGHLSEIRNEFRRFKALAAKEDDMRDDNLLCEIAAGKTELDAFLSPYEGLVSCENGYAARLQKLRFEAEQFGRIEKKRTEYFTREKEIIAKEQEILSYIHSLGFEGGEGNLPAKLGEIREKLSIYRRACAELSRVEAEKLQFESSNNISEITAAPQDQGFRSVNEIQGLLNSCAAEKESIIDRIGECRNTLSAELENLDSLREKEELLNEKEEEFAGLKKREALISKTRELLVKAKASFVGKYTEGVSNGFRKYYGLVDGTDGNEYAFDANMNLFVDDHGGLKELYYYSSGSRDKIGICFRMGLIEAMFKGEKPFIIMDDPFVNLDQKRIEGGLKMLDVLKDDYQIIYLTCHGSRMPEG